MKKRLLSYISTVIITAGIAASLFLAGCESGNNGNSPCKHDWNAFVQTTVPSCATAGVKTRTCKLCQETGTELGDPALGCDWSVFEHTTEPSCTTAGIKTGTCKRCLETSTEPGDPALGHNWSAFEQTAEPTCTTAGIKTRTCKRCPETGTEPGDPAIGGEHDFTGMKCVKCNESVMVNIPAGSFTRNGLTVTLNGFHMSRFLVTQELYLAVMGVNPSFFHGGTGREPAPGEIQSKRPVDSVSWYDAIVFCNKLSISEGLTPAYSFNGNTNPDDWGPVPTFFHPAWNQIIMVPGSAGYRLPTEAQYEYACRAGTDPSWYWYFGNNESELVNYAWYVVNSNNMSRQVGLKLPNAWGLYDMNGNLIKWCWDWFGENFPNPADLDNPTGPPSGTGRVDRGGAYYLEAVHHLQSHARGQIAPEVRNFVIGFRLVRPLD